jgi:hypothetical protein
MTMRIVKGHICYHQNETIYLPKIPIMCDSLFYNLIGTTWILSSDSRACCVFTYVSWQYQKKQTTFVFVDSYLSGGEVTLRHFENMITINCIWKLTMHYQIINQTNMNTCFSDCFAFYILFASKSNTVLIILGQSMKIVVCPKTEYLWHDCNYH